MGQVTEPVHSITDAPQRHSEEQRGRMVRYAVSMGIRVVCFALAVFLPYGWMTWVFLAAAVVLPYMAVTVANAGTDRYTRQREAEVDPQLRLSAPGRTEEEPRQWWEDEDGEQPGHGDDGEGSFTAGDTSPETDGRDAEGADSHGDHAANDHAGSETAGDARSAVIEGEVLRDRPGPEDRS